MKKLLVVITKKRVPFWIQIIQGWEYDHSAALYVRQDVYRGQLNGDVFYSLDRFGYFGWRPCDDVIQLSSQDANRLRRFMASSIIIQL